MLPSNTNVPEVDNEPSWYPCQPVPGLYTTGLYIHVYRPLVVYAWLVSVSCPDCVCLPPFSLRGYTGSGHETWWYGPTGHLQF